MPKADDPAPPATERTATAATVTQPEKPPAQPAAGAATKKPSVEAEGTKPVNKLRRRVVWSSIAAYLVANFFMFLRFFFPRALFEPTTVFHIGYPSDFALGVNEKYKQLARIWVIKEPTRLYIIYARCVHLGCTPDWKPNDNKFKCPCHGSGYTPEGINFEGPAPRPMDRAHVELDATGQIVVDTRTLYSWPKGGTDQFETYPGAYIKLV
jgi:cytochrome b6-f complex iron-sulfur subunit